MIARTASEAVNTYLWAIQQALACVTRSIPTISRAGRQPATAPHRLALNDGMPVPLGGANHILLKVVQHYRIVPSANDPRRWSVAIVEYGYTIYSDNRTSEPRYREIVAYHRHPHVEAVTFPHVHVSAGAVQPSVLERAGLSASGNALRPDLARAHLPTRGILLQDVLRLAITDFAVRPLRANWDEVLRRTESAIQGEHPV